MAAKTVKGKNSKNTRTAGKSTASKSNTSSKTKKKSTAAKNTSAKNNNRASGKTAENRAVTSERASVRRDRRSGLIVQLFPGVMVLIAILVALSLLIPNSMGFLGPFMRGTLFGLFSYGAAIVPIAVAVGAFFWKRDYENRAVGYKVIFALFFTVFFSVLLYVFTGAAMRTEKIDDIVYFFDQGKLGVGGGAIGGLFGMMLCRAIGAVGTVIVSVVLLLLLGTSYVGLTPYAIWLHIAYRLHERRERIIEERAQRSRAREDERRYYSDDARYEDEEDYRYQVSPSDNLNRRKRKINMSGANTEIDESVPEETADSSRRVPKIKGIFAKCEDHTDSFDAGAEPQEIAETEAPADGGSDDALQAIDPAVFENVLRRQTEAAARGSESDDVSAEGVSSDTADSIRPIAEAAALSLMRRTAASEDSTAEEGAASDGAELTESAERLASAEKTGSAANDGPISEELLTRFLTNSDEHGKGAAELDRTYTDSIVNGPQDPELILHREALDELAAKPKVRPRARPKYVFPPMSLLSTPVQPANTDISEELQTTAKKLVDTLSSFKVSAKVVNISRGPTITRYELSPDTGVRVRSIASLVDDIALNLATSGVRIEAPIPGKAAVGIEVPNRVVSTVYLRELVSQEKFTAAQSKLTASLGEDVAGEPIYIDIAKMPHLLIAGATGQGKSVCINSMIVSLLYKAKPNEVKLILIDPKKVELNIYNGLPHLLVPVVSDPKKAAGALAWAVTEMERRFTLIEEVGARDLRGYNKAIDGDPEREKLPQIVIVIDELADLMMTAPDDVEESICRIAQKARAAGMHLVIGTQRPSTDVITGLIKANIPSRIAFRVSAQVDSRVILDMVGAEKLIGRGDMLYSPVGATKPIRVQGAYVSETEIDDILSFIGKTYGTGDYDSDIMESIEQEAQRCGTSGKGKGGSGGADGAIGMEGADPMLKSAIELAVESGKISTSLIQRRLALGYGRAAKLIDRMQEMGIVSPPEGQKPRTVLITRQQFMEMVINNETE